jgi:amino acid adenylation domain-containing protein
MTSAPSRVELNARPRVPALAGGRRTSRVGPRRLLGSEAVKSGSDSIAFSLAICALLIYRHSGQAEVSIGLLEGGISTLCFTIEEHTTFEMLRAQASTQLAANDIAHRGAPASAPNVLLATGQPPSLSQMAWPAEVELVLNPERVAGDWLVVIEHDVAAVDGGWAVDFADQWLELARQALASASRPAVQFSLFTDRARAAMPDPALPLEKPLHAPIQETILAWAAATPQAVAIVFEAREFSYAELAAFARRTALALEANGVKPGDTVAITGRRSFAVVGAMVGVLQAGGVLLMLDPKLPVLRRRAMAEQAGAVVLIRVGARADVPAGPSDFPQRTLVCDADGRTFEWPAEAAHSTARSREGGTDAYIFFTSGSTGTPKAVKGLHAGLAHFLAWQRTTFSIGPGDRASQLTALSFDVILRDTFLALTAGATLCIPDEDAVLDPSRVLPWLQANRISIVHIVPSLARLWLDQVPDGVTLPSLRHIFFAGEPLTDVLVQRWRRAFSSSSEIVNLYGPTETTLAKCFRRVADPPDRGVQPIGQSLPQTQVLILDGDHRLCGVNEAGEIAIRTPFRSAGYLGAGPANAAFLPNPWRDDADDLIYLTGDSGRLCSDGVLEIRGRIDNQLKIRGVRIEPAEIEACLARHPKVAAAVVAAREDAKGDKFLVAYVVENSISQEKNGCLDIAGYREFLREHLFEAMIPAAFVRLEILPLNANGKIDKKALPAPDLDARSGASYEAPLDERQRRIEKTWCQVLGLERVGIDDSFFDIGGHSLLAVQLVRAIETDLGLRCDLPDLFRAPTIRRLSALLNQEREQGGEAAVIALQRAGAAPPLFCICGVYLYQELAVRFAPDVPVYGIFLPIEGALYHEPDGIEPREPLTVESMAADYVRALRGVQPRGPYRLAGVSFGGVLAFEAAQQLHDAGESVTFLALLDSMLPDALQRDWIRWALEHVRQARSQGLRMFATRLIRRIGATGSGGAAIADPQSEAQRLANLRQAIYAQATRRYEPRRYAGPAILVRASDQAFFKSDIADPFYGWGQLVPSLKVCDVKGDHLGILAPPYVDALAATLRAELAFADKLSSGQRQAVAAADDLHAH